MELTLFQAPQLMRQLMAKTIMPTPLSLHATSFPAEEEKPHLSLITKTLKGCLQRQPQLQREAPEILAL